MALDSHGLESGNRSFGIRMKPSLFSLFLVFLIPFTGHGQDGIPLARQSPQSTAVALDVLFEPGKVWSQTAADVEESWTPMGFRWSSASAKDRGTIRRGDTPSGAIELSLF